MYAIRSYYEQERDPLPDMVPAVVAELVCENRLDLRRREPGEQGIEKHDALRGAEAREVRIAMARALRAVHDEEALGAESAAREQGLDASPEGVVRERRELVEERRDDGRIDREDHQVEP